MAKERTWKKLGHDGEITKWKAGVIVEGELVGRREGKFGGLLDLRTDDGKDVTIPFTAVLRNRLEKLERSRWWRMRPRLPARRRPDH